MPSATARILFVASSSFNGSEEKGRGSTLSRKSLVVHLVFVQRVKNSFACSLSNFTPNLYALCICHLCCT